MGNENVKRKTFYIQWHFLERCNLRCVHCYQKEYSSPELDKDKLFYIAKHLEFTLKVWKRYGRISLTGGEPFINKRLLFELLDFFENSPYFYWIGILTNGTLITEEDAKKLSSYKKLREVQVSLDGASKEVHEMIRGRGSFDKAIKGMKLLIENNVYTTIMFTLMRWNLVDVERIIPLALNLGVNAITIERITPTNNFSRENLSLSKQEVYIAYKRIYDIKKDIEAKGFKLKIRTSRPLWYLLDSNIGGYCPVGISSIAILHDGTVLPCRRLEIPLGNIFKDGLFKIWYTSDFFWKMRVRNSLKGKCSNCHYLAYCSGCRAEAYAYTGDPFEEDPHCFKDIIERKIFIRPFITKPGGNQ